MLDFRVAIAVQNEQEDESPDKAGGGDNRRVGYYLEVAVALTLSPTAERP